MSPQFDKLNGTITDFGNMATKNQMDAMASVVNEFIREMNRSLGGTFLQLNEMFNKAYQTQKQNNELLTGMRQQTDLNQQIMYQEQEYLTDLAQYRQSLNDASQQLAAELQNQEALIGEMRRMITQMTKTLAASYDGAQDAWNRTAEAMEDLRDSVEMAQKSRARR